MLNLENHQNKFKNILVALSIIFVAVIIVSLIQFNKAYKNNADNIEDSIGADIKKDQLGLAEKQLQEINALRAKTQIKEELADGQKNQQLGDLEKIRSAQKQKFWTVEEIHAQSDEIEKLRVSQTK